MSATTAIAKIKERPIIMGAESIRAILNNRKDVTRRVIKPQPQPSGKGSGWYLWGYEIGASKATSPKSCFWHHETWQREQGAAPIDEYCPFGKVGDRLWVREKWSPIERALDHVDGIWFAADDAFIEIENTREAADRWIDAANNDHSNRWRSPIHMPRWASRITLEIVSVRAERLQDITDADIIGEGIEPFPKPPYHFADCACLDCYDQKDKRRKNFIDGWNRLNAKRGFGWDVPQWVWRIEFKRVAAKESETNGN